MLSKFKLPYAQNEADLVDYYNYMAKSLNQLSLGEKFTLVKSIPEIIPAMNKMAASLNSRKILNMNLQYVSENDSLLDKYNWAAKVINSSRG